MSAESSRIGVRIAGVGASVPDRRLTNNDLESMMDTSDEWIVQRTGIRERRVISGDEGTSDLAERALRQALDEAGTAPTDLDMILAATMTSDMPTPGVASVMTGRFGCRQIPAIDLNAACSGFVYSLNMAYAMMSSFGYGRAAVVGADAISKFMVYDTRGRGSSILFGDGAGAVVLERTDDTSLGLLAQTMHSDGDGAKHLYIPRCQRDYYDSKVRDPKDIGIIEMNGKAVFKFAVAKFTECIEETLAKAGLQATDVQHYVCHQANIRILEFARERFGLREDQLAINIDRLGNTVAASAPLVFDEIRREGRVKPGDKVMFLAFGAGLTWATSLWQV